MANFVFNIAKGRIGHYFSQAGTGNAAVILVPLESSGLEAQSALEDSATLSEVLDGATNEQTTMGRKTITSGITVTVDNTDNRLEIDVADQTWAAATGNAVGSVIFCYDADTTAGTDANIIPLTHHDFAVTPDGSDIVLQTPNQVAHAS